MDILEIALLVICAEGNVSTCRDIGVNLRGRLERLFSLVVVGACATGGTLLLSIVGISGGDSSLDEGFNDLDGSCSGIETDPVTVIEIEVLGNSKLDNDGKDVDAVNVDEVLYLLTVVVII